MKGAKPICKRGAANIGIAFVVIALALGGCGADEEPTLDANLVQTRIAATLAAVPTAAPLTPRPVVPPATIAPATSTPLAISTVAPTVTSDQVIEYVVERGDSLSAIAARFKTSMAAIQLLNNLETTQVRVGQRLKIPTTRLAEDENPYWIIHVVQPGETLSTIAARYRVPMERLQTLNRINNPSRVLAGQKLIIPLRGPAN